MLRRRGKRFIPAVVFACLTCAHAQFELPNEIFERTLLIRSGHEMATAFKFDHGGQLYLVTTRHLGKTLPPKNAVIQVWHGRWIDLQTSAPIFPASKEVDLAILPVDERMERPFKVVQSSEVLTTGQKVWYMGWLVPMPTPSFRTNMPATSRPIFPEIPMVRIGTITAIDPSRPDSFEIHVDAPYSLRIASGPIVYWSPVHQDYEVLGVIERNERDATDGAPNPGPPEKVVRSRVLKGYSFDIITDTLKNLRPGNGQ